MEHLTGKLYKCGQSDFVSDSALLKVARRKYSNLRSIQLQILVPYCCTCSRLSLNKKKQPDESGVINGCNGDNTQHFRSIFNLRHISN